MTPPQGRVLDAVEHVGPTLFGAALTTAASLVLMGATDSVFLRDLSIMVIGALCWSLAYAFLLFVPLCALFGPAGTHRHVALTERDDRDADED